MRISISAFAVLAGLAIAATGAVAGDTPSAEGAKVYLITPKDGETVKSPVTLRFGLSGMGIAPAGIEKENTGHHHLIIDEEISGDELNDPLPADDKHIHFGGGQTETTIELEPGEHTLQLVLGDAAHTPHNPPVMSEPITITVE